MITDKMKQEVQVWIDDRFGIPNTINIQVYLDFMEFILKKYKKTI